MGSIFVVMRNTVDGLTHNIHKETNGDRETIYNFHILHYVKKKILRINDSVTKFFGAEFCGGKMIKL